MATVPNQSQHQSDEMDPARAAALAVMLDCNLVHHPGEALPPFFHQAYFWTTAPATQLGRDGHPRVGGIIPDMGLPRRMWAGGRLVFHEPLHSGTKAEKLTTRESHQLKKGRSGALGFVTLRHEIRQDGALRVSEWQDLVYRPEADLTAPKPQPPRAREDAESEEQVSFNSTKLFRYSALTFNGHRIHYDLAYAREVEGYDGLVVHGPLLAQYLMLKAAAELGPLRAFSFRATSPLMDFETATLCRHGLDLWVRGPDGRQCMEAQAET